MLALCLVLKQMKLVPISKILLPKLRWISIRHEQNTFFCIAKVISANFCSQIFAELSQLAFTQNSYLKLKQNSLFSYRRKSIIAAKFCSLQNSTHVWFQCSQCLNFTKINDRKFRNRLKIPDRPDLLQRSVGSGFRRRRVDRLDDPL